MRLYNLTLQPSTAVIAALCGSFTAAKTQEILLGKSKSLELYTINDKGKLQLIGVEELFCVVRTVVSFRFHGTNKDIVIVGSDSGKVILLEYNAEERRFRKTHEETFGKSGCRRIVPGQFIAVDPQGQAIMIAALEKQKFVYPLKRDNQSIVIASPREAHKSHTLCTALCALDVGNQNSIFVALEIDYGEVEDKEALINQGGVKKSLVYYEMDFGMNNVIRKKDLGMDQTAHMLIPVPAQPDGPGGVLVVLEDFLFYKGVKEEKWVRFPLRKGRTERKTQFTAYTTYHQKHTFFFFISSELGDLFKVQFILKDSCKQVASIKIQYIDTFSPLVDICLTKNGYLFCASEKQDHLLLAITEKNQKQQPIYTHSQMHNNMVVQFQPKTGKKQSQLVLCDSLEQYGPATDVKVADLKGDGNPQIYLLNASGSGRSYLRVIKQGLKVKELSSIKYQKGYDIWSLKSSLNDEYDSLIIISFAAKTAVLKLTESGYSQTSGTGIEADTKTLHVGRLRDNSLIQITPNGFRHIRKGDNKNIKIDKGGNVLKGITNSSQIALALTGGDIVYYELTNSGDFEQHETSLDDEVVSMDFAPIEKNRVRSQFLAVALRDMTVRIFQLNPDSYLRILSTQNMKQQIQSVVIEEMELSTEQEKQKYGSELYLYTGLANGMLIRTSIDTITGKLTDSRPKYLGVKPVKCVKMKVLSKPAILALSSRPWLIYTYNNQQMTTLISYPYLDCAVSARTPTSQHAIIGFSDITLKLINLENFGKLFHSEKIPLDYSGKKLLIFNNQVGIVESQRRPSSMNEKQSVWKSQITIYNPTQKQKEKSLNSTHKIPMEEDQTCTAICYCEIENEKGEKESYLVAACVKGLEYYPKMRSDETSIKVFHWVEGKIQLKHKTEIEDVALVLHPWEGKILAGVGNCLRSYEIGRKKLLRKAEIKNLNSPVNTIKTSGKRIFATQISDSFHMYKYKARQQTFYDISDDILPRYVTVSCLLDDHTIIGGDKFQNIFVSRVPRNAEEDFENNPNSYKFQWQHGYLNGAPFKMQQICSFYVGEVVTSIEKASLATSGTEILIYSTINGGIGALCPLETRQDVDFFTHLEIYLRNLTPNLSGRDHLNYRSYYSPCKGIIDGDLCEVFSKLLHSEQIQIAKHLDLTPQEIHKKLEEMRNRLI